MTGKILIILIICFLMINNEIYGNNIKEHEDSYFEPEEIVWVEIEIYPVEKPDELLFKSLSIYPIIDFNNAIVPSMPLIIKARCLDRNRNVIIEVDCSKLMCIDSGTIILDIRNNLVE